MRIAQCRSCRAPILWMLTANNKSIPVDVESGGLEDEIDALPDDTQFDPKIHVSHFATCPNADRHRRPKMEA